jgi:uncharacterized coiled-coil DUF342 family protein
MYEADKTLAKEKIKTFSTKYDKINHMQQIIDELKQEIQNLRRELEQCHEQITKLSPK